MFYNYYTVLHTLAITQYKPYHYSSVSEAPDMFHKAQNFGTQYQKGMAEISVHQSLMM